MKWPVFLTILSLLGAAVIAPAAAPPASPSTLAWKQTDSTLALVNGEKVVWQFNYKKEEGKPYFHPVTIAGSPTLTDLRPKDHPWHRALWFSWKTINGRNYWEDQSRNNEAMGLTDLLDVHVTPQADHSARFELKLSYHPPGEPPVLTENRVLAVSAPTAAGAWQIDWLSTFTAGGAEVHLDRTPIVGEPEGKPFGGYAGLSLRLDPALREWRFVGAEGPVTETNTTSRWMSFSGPLQDGKAATILVLDHPQSFRHPTAWYLISRMPYFSPAVLYYKPYTLPAGQSMTLKYRILFQPGALDRDAAQQAWQRFAAAREER